MLVAVDNIELMFIHLATGSEAVFDSMCTVPPIFHNTGGYFIAQYMPYQIIESLWYDIILGMD